MSNYIWLIWLTFPFWWFSGYCFGRRAELMKQLREEDREVKALKSRLDRKETALCTANDRYDTVVEERDAALARLSEISKIVEEWQQWLNQGCQPSAPGMLQKIRDLVVERQNK